jgi:hypothetical protein
MIILPCISPYPRKMYLESTMWIVLEWHYSRVSLHQQLFFVKHLKFLEDQFYFMPRLENVIGEWCSYHLNIQTHRQLDKMCLKEIQRLSLERKQSRICNLLQLTTSSSSTFLWESRQDSDLRTFWECSISSSLLNNFNELSLFNDL